jgi:anti-sigma factor RsiW
MCPERQLLSVYLDGELPSPWKEKMEAHLHSCPACAASLERFKRCGDVFHQPDDPALRESQDRVWARLSALHEAEIPARARVWRRSVAVPLPAVAAAAAVFVFALVLAFARQPLGGQQPAMVDAGTPAPVNVQSDIAGQNIVPASDMGDILHYLEQDAADYMIIKLPESRMFPAPGAPEILNAVDYSRRSGGQ